MTNIHEYTYDSNIINTLKSFCNLGAFGPGALLYNPNTEGMHEQLSFIAKAVQNKNINYVLETGTESGLFCYFIKCLLPDVQVITFGMNGVDDDRAQKCTDFLNTQFNNYIKFIEGELCKRIFSNLPYNPVIELPYGSQGGDGLLVYKLKK